MKKVFVFLFLIIGICNSIFSQTVESKNESRREYPNDKEMQDYIYNQQKLWLIII